MHSRVVTHGRITRDLIIQRAEYLLAATWRRTCMAARIVRVAGPETWIIALATGPENEGCKVEAER